MGSDVRKYKVVLLGDAGVGKTSLVNMYVNKVFGGKYLKTLGTNIYSKEIIESLDGKEVTSLLQVWDVMGQKVFPSVVKTSLKGASGAIFVCDLTNIESLNNLVTWVQLVFDNCENISLVFLANKSDLDNPAFGFYSVKAFADIFEAPFYVTSAKTGAGVDDAFHRIASRVINQRFVPAECRFDLEPVGEMIPYILLAEDQIIHTYCNFVGGFEKAMPQVQEGFKHLKIDFEKPTREDLEVLVTHLLSEGKYSLTDEEVERMGLIFEEILTETE